MRRTTWRLLEVLLAEEGEIGAGLQEEFRDDGGDAVEMAGAEAACQAFADAGDRDGGREALADKSPAASGA